MEEGLNGRTTLWDDPFVEGRNGKTYLLPCLRTHAPIDLLPCVVKAIDSGTIEFAWTDDNGVVERQTSPIKVT